ncbi:hypothetical protein M9Y10_002904 [Tritrichomonas musculus]|uniref:Protein kinase domain-containing protein n=1 Tax=Tritrichomonas musculus TaxID=1915356 RepID=A0ABR2LD43_9EUKA
MAILLSNFIINIENNFDINPEIIYQGSYGQVREGFRKSDNFHVAIKTITDPLVSQSATKGLLREFELLAGINHPKCLKLITFSLDPPRTVTPFMSNGTLNDFLVARNEGADGFEKMTPTKMMCTVYGMCSTMQFLHMKGIVHRDFKPLNVFLDDNYDICIADFGLSRRVRENVDLTKQDFGSPAYMAPELLEGIDYDNKIDVYSFGVTYLQYFSNLEELDDGMGPFRTAYNLLKRISEGARFVRPSGMNDAQWNVYTYCTDRNMGARPSFAEISEEFETNKELWFEGVDEDEYLRYVNDCKKIIREEKENLEQRENLLRRDIESGESNSSDLFSSLPTTTIPIVTHTPPRPLSKSTKPKRYYV